MKAVSGRGWNGGLPGQPGGRPRAAGAVRMIGVTAAWLIAAGAAAAAPEHVAVRTSRGAFDLQLYAPADPKSPDPAAPARTPLEPPASPADRAGGDHPAILLISGEGGWASFVDHVAGMLAAEGFWVGGLDCKKYFAEPQDDRQALAADVRAYADALIKAAGRPAGSPVVLAGFSFGADVAPWIASDAGWSSRVRGLLLIAPDAFGSLEYRWLEMVGIDFREHTFEVAAALRDAAGIPVLFVHGESDGSSAAPELARGAAEPKRLSVVRDAGHHFSGQDDRLREALREGLDWLLRQPPRPRPVAGKKP